jgi:hypothetical protein
MLVSMILSLLYVAFIMSKYDLSFFLLVSFIVVLVGGIL